MLRRLAAFKGPLTRRFLHITSRESILKSLEDSGFTLDQAGALYDSLSSAIDCSLDVNLGADNGQLLRLDELVRESRALETKMHSLISDALKNNASSTTAFSSKSPSMIKLPDAAVLEQEILLTGQKLNDELRQLQADVQLDANLEEKRLIEATGLVDGKVELVKKYAEERIEQINGSLDRVSKQVMSAIAGFIGITALAFISYSLGDS